MVEEDGRQASLKLYFIHVRKNAGMSLIDFFFRAGVDVEVVNRPVKDCLSVGVARNPYSRCVSGWRHCHTTRDRKLIDCLANPPGPNDPSGEGLKLGHDYRHFTKKQVDFLFDGGIIPSYILKFENLYDDLYKLCSEIDIPFVGLNHFNNNQYEYMLSDYERQAIQQLFLEDFNQLGYEK
jgi:hypothetical protein